jgi:hypothetical protein
MDRLKEFDDAAKRFKEDAAYTKQFFTISRQAHVRSTQSFGTPALIWHTAFWPKRDIDPQDLDDPTPEPQRQGSRASYDDRRKRLARDLDGLLEKLQLRGRAPGQSGKPLIERFGDPAPPADWETGKSKRQDPVGLFATESIAFTIWWGDDSNRAACPAAPLPEDLRVRVQANVHPDFFRDADVHIRIYGQLLDQIMRKATGEANRAQLKWWKEVYPRAQERLSALWRQAGELDRLEPKAKSQLQKAHAECVAALQAEAAKLSGSGSGVTDEVLLLTERPVMLYRRLLDDIANAVPEHQPGDESIFALAQHHLNEARKDKSQRDEDLAQINRQADLELIRVKTYIDELGRDAIGGLPFPINRSRYYADMYRTMVKTLRVGTIDTWWDYEQLASRGVEPPFKFIDNVGTRLEGLRVRLRDAMEAVQTSAIANQTEATRDNTYQLEVIARGIQQIEQQTNQLKRLLLEGEIELVKTRTKSEHQLQSHRRWNFLLAVLTRWDFWVGLGLAVVAGVAGAARYFGLI